MAVLYKIVLIIILAIVAKRLYSIVGFMSFGKHVYNHSPGPCRLLDGIDKGSEDIEVLPNGIAFITSGMKCITDITNPIFKERNGKIFTFNFNKPDQKPIELKIKGKMDTTNWGPHGISLFRDKVTGKVTLFVIVHRPSGDSIEKFRYVAESDTLEHIESITGDDHILLANDIKAVSEKSFYFTNYRYFRGPIGQKMEFLLGLTWCSVIFYDGKTFRPVVESIDTPNGINTSPDGKYVYVAMISAQSIRVFQRNKDNTLKFLKDIKVHTFADNIDVDPVTGDIWTGCHPIGHLVMEHLENPVHETPSQVLRLKMKDGDVTSITEMYSNTGKVLKGSTAAVHYKGAFLIGTVHDKVLYCQIKNE